MLSQFKYSVSNESTTLTGSSSQASLLSKTFLKSAFIAPNDIFTVGLSFTTCLATYNVSKLMFMRLANLASTTVSKSVTTGKTAQGNHGYLKTGFKDGVRTLVSTFADSDIYTVAEINVKYRYCRASYTDMQMEDYSQIITNVDIANFSQEKYIEVDRNTGLIKTISASKPDYDAATYVFHYWWIFNNPNKVTTLNVTVAANDAVLTINCDGQSDYLLFRDNLEGNTSFPFCVFHTYSTSISNSFNGAQAQVTPDFEEFMFVATEDYSHAKYEIPEVYSRV